MPWLGSTSTELISGTSTMSSGSALNRAVTAIPGSRTLTGWKLTAHVSPGASGSTYNSFTSGQQAHVPSWLIGIAYVVTGGTVPNLDTDADDSQILWAGEFDPFMDRNTINQAGSPAYADQFIYSVLKEGYLQLHTGVGGSLYMLLANISTGSVNTAWQTTVRAMYV